MQRIARYTKALLIGAVLGIASCDKGFEEMNVNPNAPTAPNVDFLFSQSILKGNYVYDRAYFYTSYITCGNYVQHFATGKEISVAGSGDKYGVYDFYQSFYYRYTYTNVLTTLKELIRAAEAPELVNKKSAARIWRVLIMQRMTDLYGDVPYSDANKALTDANFLPKYDAQADIYADLLKELDESIAAFSDQQPKFATADLLYGGDIAKWKKFAYSLMLRVAMRMTKVDADKARQWATKAIQGGIILQAADQAVVKYFDGPQIYNSNPIAYEIVNQDLVAGANGAGNTEWGKFSKTFIDQLKNTNDPRLGVVSVVWRGNVADTSFALQKGLPNGTDGKPTDFVTYSEPNPATILKYSAPLIVLSRAEMHFLLTEAILRGWATGTAAATYKTGIEAAMQNWALFGAGGVIPQAKIDAYTAARPLTGTLDQQLSQVHTQFWIASLLDEQEAYANWRRTGYPVLTPVNFTGNATGGTIPRRLPYAVSEQGINKKHYDEAVARQGPDRLTTRIWWDKQ
ncbi:SusD/RagB family nutrient-binding outer membrane lipoprotein [Chitinophaga lutea]